MAVQLCCVFGKSGDGWQCVWVTAQLASACWWASRALVHGCAAVLCVW